jgi:hypothetical protein
MSRIQVLLLALLGLVFASAAAAQAPPAPAVTAFVDVNVVPMDSERVLQRQTVLVEKGRITAIGPDLQPPAGARVIDGHGTAYLSPGLADMHVHSESREDMRIYLAHGVTTVLNMGGASAEFMGQRRPALNSGRIPGPHVYAAFRVDSTPRYGQFVVTTPEEARWAVRLAKTNGYDFIKAYNDLSPECFQALVEEGRAQGLPVVGHGVTRVGLERQLDAGQVMVAHAEEFLYTTFAPKADAPGFQPPDAAQVRRAIGFVLRDKAYVTADLATYAVMTRQWGRPEVVESMLKAPETRELDPHWRLEWRRADYASRKGSIADRLAFLQGFVRELSLAGVPLIAGTDAPTIPGVYPGVSLHDDLDALTAAGLSRYQALATATRAAGAFIARSLPGSEAFGTVTAGARADLILSQGDPLRDLSTLRRPLGVMAAGRWYPRGDLQDLRDGVTKAYAEALVPAG